MEWFTFIKGLSGIILFYFTGLCLVRICIALMTSLMEKFFDRFDTSEDRYFSALDQDMGRGVNHRF
jgi:hypothetical protein